MRGGVIISAVGLASLLTAIDNTVVNLALPQIGRDLDSGLTWLQWVSMGYILAFGSMLVLGGALSDRYGRRPILLIGLALFAAGAGAAGLAPDVVVLVAARMVQGAGAALVVPATLAVVAADLGERHRALGGAVWAGAVATAFAVGPILSGVVTEFASWRWLLLGQVPLAAVVAWALRGVPRRAATHARPEPIDVAGVALSAVLVLTIVLTAMSAAGGSPLAQVLGWAAAAAAAGALLVAVERRAARALLDAALLRDPLFTGGTLTQVLWGVGLGGVLFTATLHLQGPLGYTPARAGLAMVPLALALIAVVPLAPYAAYRLGLGTSVTLGLVTSAVGLVWASGFGADDAYSTLWPALVLVGAGSALITPLVTESLVRVDPARVGAAAAVASGARETSAALGVAMVGGLHDFGLSLQISAGVVMLAAIVAALTVRGWRATAEPEVPALARVG